MASRASRVRSDHGGANDAGKNGANHCFQVLEGKSGLSVTIVSALKWRHKRARLLALSCADSGAQSMPFEVERSCQSSLIRARYEGCSAYGMKAEFI